MSCEFLHTALGEAVMTWATHFVAECRAAIAAGVDPDKGFSINMNGPDGNDLKLGTLSGRGKKYGQFDFTIKEVAESQARLLATPDFDVLIEEYGDDPVLKPTLQWMKARYGR